MQGRLSLAWNETQKKKKKKRVCVKLRNCRARKLLRRILRHLCDIFYVRHLVFHHCSTLNERGFFLLTFNVSLNFHILYACFHVMKYLKLEFHSTFKS